MRHPGVGVGRTEIPGRSKAQSFLGESFCKHEVSSPRLEDELPWFGGRRVPDQAGLARQESLMRSGMSRSLLQSPPPITFPARAGEGDAVTVEPLGWEE